MRTAARVFRYQQPLLVVCQLDARAGDFDSRARAGALLVLRLSQNGLGQGYVCPGSFNIRVRADSQKIGSRHQCRHPFCHAFHV